MVIGSSAGCLVDRSLRSMSDSVKCLETQEHLGLHDSRCKNHSA
jgi:hypothetical protein